MTSGVIGLIFCSVGLVATGISIGIPYWIQRSPENFGLWQYCVASCDFIKFPSPNNVWFDAVRIIEVIGAVFGLVGTPLAFLAVCSKKTRKNYVAAGMMSLIGGACVAAGFITYAKNMASSLEYAHAGFYLNIVGCVGLGIGGLILLCTRGERDTNHQPGHVIHYYDHQQPGYHSNVHISRQRRY